MRFMAPARQCEFARASLERQLHGNYGRPKVIYLGCLRSDQTDVQAELESLVYKHWDESDSAPPKSRPQDALADPDLTLL